MKRLLLVLMAALVMNCSTTQLVDTWRNPDVPEFSSNKILIVGMAADKKARKIRNKRTSVKPDDKLPFRTCTTH